MECSQTNGFAKSNQNPIIHICVGGRNFKTTRTTLMSDENSMLAKMFENDISGRSPAVKDENGYYFIDRSPKYFESILNFLRTGEVEAPACLDVRFLLKEAEFYGIEGMADKIREELQKKEAYENHMREHCEQLNCIQQCCQNYLSQIAEYTARQAETPALISPAFPNGHVANLNFQNQQGGPFPGHVHFNHGHHHHHHGHP